MRDLKEELFMKNLFKIGGICFIISVILFFLVIFLSFPPSAGQQIASWTVPNVTAVELTNESLFFATLFLIPAIFALYTSLSAAVQNRAIPGCGIIATMLPAVGSKLFTLKSVTKEVKP